MPGLRNWLFEADLGRWASVLGTLLDNRVPVIRALQLSAAAVRVEAIAADVGRLAAELERGRTLADALREHAWFPASRVNLVRVGERSGQLPRTLATLGAMHTDAARGRQRRLLTLVESVAILVIGVVVGFVMVAVMSAITSVNSIATWGLLAGGGGSSQPVPVRRHRAAGIPAVGVPVERCNYALVGPRIEPGTPPAERAVGDDMVPAQ